MLDYSIKYRAVRKMLDEVLSTLDRTSDFTKLYELSNRVSAKLELIDEMDRMDPPCIMSGYGAVLDKEPGEPAVVEHGVPGQHGEILDIVRTHSVEPGKGKVETADTVKAGDAPVVSVKWAKDFFGDEPLRYMSYTKIGVQEWTIENLQAKDDPANGIFVQRGETFFTYDAAVREAKKYEKDGWRLPTVDDVTWLVHSCGGCDIAGRRLKGRTGWGEDGNGSDAYGFRAIPAGVIPAGLIADMANPQNHSHIACFSCADEFNCDHAYRLKLSSTSNCTSLTWMPKIYGYSVRLVRDAKK